MLKSPHALKLVGSLFIFFSFFVVYSTFTRNPIFSNSDQKAQLVSAAISSDCYAYAPNLYYTGPAGTTYSYDNIFLDVPGTTKEFKFAYQNPPTMLQWLAFSFPGLVPPYTTPIPPCLRTPSAGQGNLLNNDRYIVANGNNLYIGSGNYQNNFSFTLTKLIFKDKTRPVAGGYYAYTGAERITKEDDIIRDVDVNKKISGFIKYISANGNPTETFSVPATNCQKISGNGSKKIVFMRGSSWNSNINDFLLQVDSAINDGFKQIDPFKTYINDFSFYVDLKKIDETKLTKSTNADSGAVSYTSSAATSIKTQSSCGGDGLEYIFLTDDKSLYPAYTLPANEVGKTENVIAIQPLYTQFCHPETNLICGFADTVIHETGHAIANLGDEYLQGFSSSNLAINDSNCAHDPEKQYRSIDNRVYAGAIVGDNAGEPYYAGCTLLTDKLGELYRPSRVSIMNSKTLYFKKFNVISCGYLVSAIKGESPIKENAQKYWPQCLNLDTYKAGIPPVLPAPVLTGISTVALGRVATATGSGFTPERNNVQFVSPVDGQIYEVTNISSPDGNTLTFTVPTNLPVLPASSSGYLFKAGALNSPWSNILTIKVADSCTPTISSPFFDPVYITETQNNRGFTPALPITPFDNFYIDFQFEPACPAIRISQMTPSLSLTISDDVTKILKTGSLTKQGSTNTYRWSLTGWPNGIISDQALMVELLEHSAFSLPATVELNESGSIKSLAQKDINMSSCVQVQGSDGLGKIPIVLMGSERFGDDGVTDRGAEGLELLKRAINTKQALSNTDPFKKYYDSFVLYADLKPISYKDDWRLTYSRLKQQPGYYDFSPQGRSELIARELSSCKFVARNYLVFGDKLTRAASWGDGTNGVAEPGLAMVRKLPSPTQEYVSMHEIGHSFGHLDDEYVFEDIPNLSMDKTIGTNCTTDPASRYSYEGKQYAELDEFGCMGSSKYNKPTAGSIMDSSYSSTKFNKISCAYIIAKIKGGDPKSYYAECAGLDVVDPGENLPGVPITVLTQETDEVWLSDDTYKVRWLMPEGFNPASVQEVVISLVDKNGSIKYGFRDSTLDAIKDFKELFTVDRFLLNFAPPGEYRIGVKVVPKQNGIGIGFSKGKVIIKIAEPAPIVTPPADQNQTVTPGQSTTINGSGFTPTGNKVQLIKTGGPTSVAPQSLFQKFAVLLTRGVGSVASVIGASVTPASVATDLVTTYEIKDLPSNGTSLTFTIPSNIPPGTYTMKVAGLNSNYSEGVTITIASPVPAPVLTSLNHTSSITNSWVIALGSGFSTSTTGNTDKVGFFTATTSVEAVAGISASNTGDTYVDPSIPNLTPGTYSAFKVPTTLAPGPYSVKVAHQNGAWSNALDYTVLPVMNLDGSYNFAYVIATKPAPPIVVTVSKPNTEVRGLGTATTTPPTLNPNRPNLTQLLNLIRSLTAQLQTLKAGKTITGTPVIPTITLPTTTSCTTDVFQCPDGSFVGRTPPGCAFRACPSVTPPPPPTFTCPTDTQSCPNGSTVSRTPPLCLFAACPNTFVPPPIVIPPPPVVTLPSITLPSPTTTTLPPAPAPITTEPTLSASLTTLSDDRAGVWGVFAPGPGNQYGTSKGDIHDFVWNATLTLSSSKTIRSINLTHNTNNEYWSTDNGNAYPLVIFYNGTQLNTDYSQSLGTYGQGSTNLTIYGQFETPTFSGGTLTIAFTDNTTVTATIPASSFSPCTTCNQAGAVYQAMGTLWDTLLSTLSW